MPKQSFHMSKTLLCLVLLWIQPDSALAQKSSNPPGGQRDQTTTSHLYTLGTGDRLESAARISQYQKLIDDKNYEVTTAYRVPSINGGELIDREVAERSRKISANRYEVERVIRNPDVNGRLATHEMVKEEHQLKGNSEEIQRSYYRADINGKMAAHAVENETVTKISSREKQITRALYRPDAEGKFSLAELEEATERKVSDSISVKDSNLKLKEASGRVTVVGSSKETITKLSDRSFKKEVVAHRAGDNGVLLLAEKVTETQTESPDGTRKYQRLLESRNVSSLFRNPNSTGLILSQRVTGEERRLPDGSIESTTQIETIDPANQSNGLRVSEIVTEISRPLPSGKISVERTVKVRDVNGNYTISQKIAQIVEPTE